VVVKIRYLVDLAGLHQEALACHRALEGMAGVVELLDDKQHHPRMGWIEREAGGQVGRQRVRRLPG
jgi:hypothetical protein